jgi:alpha-beta hydrolase superfamily lysophospholipase
MRLDSCRTADAVAVRIPLVLATLALAVCLLLPSCATSLSSKKPVKPALGKDTWQSYDGKVMPWSDKPVADGKKPKAVVITVHGLSGAAMDFWMLEDEWPRRGMAVCGLQLRGQGNDPVKRARGNISSAQVWQKDLATFHHLVKQRYPGVPVLWYAESLGTLIALHTITDQMPDPQEWPAGIVMSSPAAGLRLRPKGLKASMLYTAIATMPFMRVNLERLGGVNDKDIRVTHDTTHGAQMAVTSHYVSHFSLRLLGEVDFMMRTAPTAAPKLTIPVLMLASPNDVIASEAQIESLYRDLGSKDKTIRWYMESYHLLLHDTQRQQVLKDATEWVESRAGR